LVAAGLLAEANAAAKEMAEKDIDAQERIARTACLSGDYAKGVAILSELFVATEDPVFIFNQGRCFEQNHRHDDAIARFEEYLRVGKKLPKADRADAKKHIATCKAEVAKQAAAQSQSAAATAKDAKERAAKKACLNKDPAKGVELLTDLYVDTNDAIYIYNQGRCYEQSDRCEEAIVRFREYLRKRPDTSARDRADVSKHIADCEALLAKAGTGAGTTTTTAPGAQASKPPAVQIPIEPLAPPLGGGTTAGNLGALREGQRAPGGGLRIAGAITMGLGGALLVTGVILNLKHNSTISNIQGDYSGDDDDSAQLYQTLSTVGYAAGAACLVGGAVLYWLGVRAGRTMVVPSLAAGQAGLMLAGEL
jgi:tetratricopeptide (TPR) repeat protein